MRELGLTDVRAEPGVRVGRLGSVAPEKVVAACVHAGLAVTGLRRRRTAPRRHLRRADRGGIRCQRLRWRSVAGRAARAAGPRRGSCAPSCRLIFRRRRNQIGLLVLAAVPILIADRRQEHRLAARRRRPRLLPVHHRERAVRRAVRADDRARAVPAAGDLGDRGRRRSPARPTSGPCATCSPFRWPGCDSWRVKYAALVVFAFIATLTGGLDRDGHRSRAVRRRRPHDAVGHPDLVRGRASSGSACRRRTSRCCLASLGAVGLFISTLTEQPIAATIATLFFSAASLILDAIPQVAWLHPYLLTHHWMAFGDLLRDPIAWAGVHQGPVRRGRLRRRLLPGRVGTLRRQGRHELTRAGPGPGAHTRQLTERAPVLRPRQR